MRTVRPRPASLRRTRGAVEGGLALAGASGPRAGVRTGLEQGDLGLHGLGRKVRGQGASRLAESSWGVGSELSAGLGGISGRPLAASSTLIRPHQGLLPGQTSQATRSPRGLTDAVLPWELGQRRASCATTLCTASRVSVAPLHVAAWRCECVT